MSIIALKESKYSVGGGIKSFNLLDLGIYKPNLSLSNPLQMKDLFVIDNLIYLRTSMLTHHSSHVCVHIDYGTDIS
jgi:hypothetical protein